MTLSAARQHFNGGVAPGKREIRELPHGVAHPPRRLATYAPPTTTTRTISGSRPDAVMMCAQSAGSAVHGHSTAIATNAKARAQQGSAARLTSAHAGGNEGAAPSAEARARSGCPPGATATESTRAACAHAAPRHAAGAQGVARQWS